MKLLAYIACGLVLVVGTLTSLKKASRFSDETLFCWDDYHALAANYAMGHGMRRGAFEPIENYHYERNDQASAEFIAVGTQGGDPALVRTRGYPFFLSLIYRVAGVHPRIVKLVQLAFVILVGAGLPWLGFYLWRGTGILPGAWAGLYYIGKYTQGARDLMAEPLFAFLLFVWTCLFVYWQRSRKLWLAFALGLLAGYCVLVKGTGIFLFPVTVVVLAWQWWRTRPQAAARVALAVFVVGYGIVAVPYSVMVSRIAGKFVLFSTQGGDAFRGGNSTVAAGWYQTEWRDQPGGFKLVPAARMPLLLAQKVDEGFQWFTSIRVAVAGLGVWLALELRRRWGERHKWAVVLGGCAFVVACFNPLAALSHGVLLQHEPMLVVFALGIGALVALHRLRAPGLDRVPLPFLIVTASLLLTTVVMFGLKRYVCVIDWMFLLSAAYLVGGAWWPGHNGCVKGNEQP
jgi:4-amino-4-deoxy-L-arabinose transferase-like glycosyltransferase